MPRRSRPIAPRPHAARPRPAAASHSAAPPHMVLGLSACEEDAVRVIEVAHLMLRRWRRVRSGEGPPGPGPVTEIEASNRIRQILAARQAMLERIHAGWRCP